MSLAFARRIAPTAPVLLAAALAGRTRARRPHRGRDWLKIAHRLAAGLPPRAAALPEGGDETLVAHLLGQEGFQAVLAAAKARLAEPPETARQRLVALARQALERALLATDPGAVLFVLEEEHHDRDPAVTLAEGVLRAEARAVHERAPTAPPIHRHPPDPLRRAMHRGSAALRDAVRVEDTLRHAALAATTEAAQVAAARRALALKRAPVGSVPPADHPADPGPAAAADPPWPAPCGGVPRGPP